MRTLAKQCSAERGGGWAATLFLDEPQDTTAVAPQDVDINIGVPAWEQSLRSEYNETALARLERLVVSGK